jgi:hypothetical protein
VALARLAKILPPQNGFAAAFGRLEITPGICARG